jgi:hypothetical protein
MLLGMGDLTQRRKVGKGAKKTTGLNFLVAICLTAQAFFNCCE